jgi:hypothetical protein
MYAGSARTSPFLFHTPPTRVAKSTKNKNGENMKRVDKVDLRVRRIRCLDAPMVLSVGSRVAGQCFSVRVKFFVCSPLSPALAFGWLAEES